MLVKTFPLAYRRIYLGQAPDPGQLFLECDNEGNILWMNDTARGRLGPVGNFLEAVPESSQAEARRLLLPRDSSDQPSLTCLFKRRDRQESVLVRFVRLLTVDNRVILTAEFKERTSDVRSPLDRDFELLMDIQRNAVRNYFRILQAQDLLKARLQRSKARGGAVLTEALERERTRLARELHAGAGQTLAGIKLNLELIYSLLPDPPEVIQGSLRRIQLLTEEAMNELRAVSHRLHPPDWQRLGLREALEWLWSTTGIPQEFHAKLQIYPFTVEPPHAVRVAVYRLSQEGLSNVLRHSGATEVSLTLEERGDRLWLRLEDNGSGFDAQQFLSSGPETGGGIGLQAMQEQVRSLNGEFEVRSGPGGTIIEVSLPLVEEQ